MTGWLVIEGLAKPPSLVKTSRPVVRQSKGFDLASYR